VCQGRARSVKCKIKNAKWKIESEPFVFHFAFFLFNFAFFTACAKFPVFIPGHDGRPWFVGESGPSLANPPTFSDMGVI
jgi:hypothetical protein